MRRVLLLLSAILIVNCTIYPLEPAPVDPTKCEKYFIYTKERGCIKSCQHPDFEKCKGMSFIDIWDPKFCAVSKDGQWKSFTFACQACQFNSIQFIAVANGECGDQGVVKPPVEPPKPQPPKCKEHEIYTQRRGCIKACSDPSWKECGDVFIAIWDPKFCALGKDGNWKSVTFDCQACGNSYPDTEFLGVSNGLCQEDAQCKIDKDCQNGFRCERNLCVDTPVEVPQPPKCKEHQIYTERRGCIQACSDPSWKECGDAFIAIWDPKFCALGKDGNWKSVTFACQACGNSYPDTEFLGVSNGICQEDAQCKADGDCQKGFKCDRSLCVDKCNGVNCPDDSSCVDGACIPPIKPVQPVVPACKQNYIYTKQKGCIKSCTHPDYNNCPTIFIALWDPKFCALDKDGNWKSYTFDCQACGGKVKKNVGVAVGKCEEVVVPPVVIDECSKCAKDQKCYNKKCVPLDFCASDKQCSTSQLCSNGKCVPREWKCADTFCKSTQKCVYGKCIKDNVIDPCALILCKKGTTCVKGECVPEVDKCALIKCKSGTECQNGECVPVDKCITVKCTPTTHCENGVCVPNIDKCSLVKCKAGFRCEDGQCVPINKCETVKCKAGWHCEDGICVKDLVIDSCALILCGPGTHCVDGKCVPDKPAGIQLPVCPTDAKYLAKNCPIPRPNDKTCPVIYYIRAPDPAYCGVRADGTRVNFAEQCTTCKDKSIVYYFDKPCHKVPFVCGKQEKCVGDVCVGKKCSTAEDCPYDWQTCSNGACQDPCIYMKCANCKYGRCGFEQPNGKCTMFSPASESECKNPNWSCVGFECADVCLRTPCPPNQKCNKYGLCEGDKQPY